MFLQSRKRIRWTLAFRRRAGPTVSVGKRTAKPCARVYNRTWAVPRVADRNAWWTPNAINAKRVEIWNAWTLVWTRAGRIPNVKWSTTAQYVRAKEDSPAIRFRVATVYNVSPLNRMIFARKHCAYRTVDAYEKLHCSQTFCHRHRYKTSL